MDEQLKEYMNELGNAINDSLSDSDRIAEAMGAIKNAGYDIFLVLEATIGFQRRSDGHEPEEAFEPQQSQPRSTSTSGKLKLNPQDHKFLKALKVAIDEESRQASDH